MARRRARKRWQRMITRFLVAAISDVRADLRAGHARAVKGRVAAQEAPATREYLAQQNAAQMTAYALQPGEKLYEPPAWMTGAQKDARRRDHSDKVRNRPFSVDEYRAMNPAQRQIAIRKAGLCGAPTRDKSPCLNPKGCSIPSHRRNRA